jgi:hypothetical protein
MSGLATIDAVFLALAFFVPGLVLLTVRSQFLTGSERQGNEQFLRYLTSSAINYAVFGPVIYWALSEAQNWKMRPLVWCLAMLVGPAFLGLLAGVSARIGLFRRLVARFGVDVVHPMPTAWDYAFTHELPRKMVLVTLKDGTEYAGYYGGKSFASSEIKERDLLLEQLYTRNDHNVWRESGSSLLVAQGEIRTIEYWAHKEADYDEESRTDETDNSINEGAEGLPAANHN